MPLSSPVCTPCAPVGLPIHLTQLSVRNYSGLAYLALPDTPHPISSCPRSRPTSRRLSAVASRRGRCPHRPAPPRLRRTRCEREGPHTHTHTHHTPEDEGPQRVLPRRPNNQKPPGKRIGSVSRALDSWPYAPPSLSMICTVRACICACIGAYVPETLHMTLHMTWTVRSKAASSESVTRFVL